MKDECYLIRDILPLYTENIVSDYTRSFVKGHLEDCPDCQKELEKMQQFTTTPQEAAPATDVLPLKHLQKKLFHKKLQIILCTAALVLALLTSAFAYLTAPQYLPYSEDMLSLTEHDDGSVTIFFHTTIPHVQCRATKYSENSTPVYFVEAWYTALDRNFDSAITPSTMTLTPNSNGKMLIYYSQNGTVSTGDASDVLLYDTYDGQHSYGVVSLPRLALGYYLMLAIFLSLLFAVALLIFHRKASIRLWLERGLLLPLSYLLGHFCVKGPSTISYSIQRDFFLILFVGLLIYCGLLCALSLYRAKRPLIS